MNKALLGLALSLIFAQCTKEDLGDNYVDDENNVKYENEQSSVDSRKPRRRK